MKHAIRSTLGLLAALAVLSSCGDSGDDGASAAGDGDAASAGGTAVSVDDNFFEPEEIEVGAGDTVTWEWVGSQPHNVSADAFQSEIQTEGTFEHSFTEAGTYEYVCTVHPGMEGIVEVTG